MNIFLVSDTHFGHANILTFTRGDGRPLRDFPSVEAMDEHMIDRWNAVIRDRDEVYHLGDVAMRKADLTRNVRRLRGRKHLVLGNHDGFGAEAYKGAGFERVFGARVLDGLLLTHYPVHRGSITGKVRANAHGHVHEITINRDAHLSVDGLYANVCVEALDDYTPISLEDLKSRIAVRQAESEMWKDMR